MAIRLVGGANSTEGRVEVALNGEWGTVCDDSWDVNDAKVVCRMLGHAYAIAAPVRSHFGQGNGTILLDDVQCTGEESSIDKCFHAGWGENNCNHEEDAGVICSGELWSNDEMKQEGRDVWVWMERFSCRYSQ